MASQSQPTTPPNARLDTVPLEVLLQITRHLKTPDYCNCRLINKDIEEKLRNAFSREFFTKRQFFLMEPSLQVLVDISKSRFSGALTHVILGLERPSVNLGSSPVHGQIYADYITFMNSEQDVEMLSEAFSNLANLDTVGMRDFNSRSRYRDSPHNQWRSYGANTYVQEMGEPLEMLSRNQLFGGLWHHSSVGLPSKMSYLKRVFLCLLRSLGKCGNRAPNYEVIMRQISLHDECFQVDGDLPRIKPVLEQLRKILLELNSESPSPVDPTNSSATISSYYLRSFLGLTSNLEHLRLNFRQYNNKDDMKNFLSWLSSPVVPSITKPDPMANLPPPTINLNKLRQLDIGNLQIEAPVLLALVKKFKSSLKVISCSRICLLNTDRVNPRKQVSVWANFFADLLRTNIDLTAINMRYLTQGRFRHNQLIERDIIFKDSRPKHDRERNWAGTTSESALRDFRSQVSVEWHSDDKDESGSEPPSEPSDIDEDDENQDDEEDEVDEQTFSYLFH